MPREHDQPRHDLEELINQASQRMDAEYRRITARAAEDPGTAGDQGEENWAELLRAWLPATYHVRTKGRVLSSSGSASPQLDVVVLSPSYPNGLLGTNLYLAAGVLAAFECKTTLRLTSIAKAVSTAVSLHELARDDASVQHDILYGLLSHSHAIRARLPEKSISDALATADRERVKDCRDALDFLCIADLGTWALMRTVFAVDSGETRFRVDSTHMGPGRWATGGSYAGSPVGRFLTGLFRRLGREDPNLGPLSSYFHAVGLFGMGAGTVREFHLDELPAGLDTVVW